MIGAATKSAAATKNFKVMACRLVVEDWDFLELLRDIPPSKLHSITRLWLISGDCLSRGLALNHCAVKYEFLTTETPVHANHREWFHFHSVNIPFAPSNAPTRAVEKSHH